MEKTWLRRAGSAVLAGALALAMMGAAPVLADETVEAVDTEKPAEETATVAKWGGDVNGDGKVDSGDALQLLRYAAELISLDALEDTAMADINGDRSIDSGDALLALRIAAEIDQPTPYYEVDCSDVVMLRGYLQRNEVRILHKTAYVDEMREGCLGDTSVLDRFDDAFFETHDLLSVSSDPEGVDSMTLRQVVQNGSRLGVYVSYTEMVRYAIGASVAFERDSVMLIPVKKQAEDAVVSVNYTYELGVSDTVYPNSFLWVSNDESIDFQVFPAQLYTVQSRVELDELPRLWCSTDQRSREYQRFCQLHDEAFYQNNATLLVIGYYASNYEFVGFRDNEDGTRTLLYRSCPHAEKSDNAPWMMAPRPCVLAVDIPKAVLAAHPVTGIEDVTPAE